MTKISILRSSATAEDGQNSNSLGHLDIVIWSLSFDFAQDGEQRRTIWNLEFEICSLGIGEVLKVTLMRGFSKVDAEGKIAIPKNIQIEVALKTGQLVELKVVGASKKKNILISTKEHAG